MFSSAQNKGSCKPCRELKLKCDEKKPRCSECISSSKICGGYDLGHIFINMNSTAPPPVWSRSRNASKYLVLDLASQDSAVQPSRPPLPDADAVALMVQDPNSIHEVTRLFLDLYYRRFGPNKSTPEPLQPGKDSGGWRALLPHWIGQSPILDTTIRAMTTCFIGAQYQDVRILDLGRDLYLSALQTVQVVLSEPNSVQRKDLLSATLIMSSIELFLSNGGGTSQITHVKGANKLLYCMVESSVVQSAEELHIYVLKQALFASISLRENCLLFSVSCRTPVRHIFSSCPNYDDNLYFQWCEHAAALPNILYTTDRLSDAENSSTSPPHPDQILDVLDDLAIVEQTLAPWHASMKANVPGPWTFPTAVSNPEGVLFPLQFVSIEACTLHCLHWMSHLLILDARATLASFLPADQVQVSSQQLRVQISGYAELICRSVQFCTKDRSFAATENMFLPLTVVARYYERQGDVERTRWCLAAFARICEEQKVGFAPEYLQYNV